MWAALFVLLLGSAACSCAAGAMRTIDSGHGLRAALFGVEVTLLTIKWWWIIVGVLLVVWLVAGSVAARERGYESSASVATGRLGLGLSIGAFLATSMAIWAMLSGVLGIAVERRRLSALPFFGVDGAMTGAPTGRALQLGRPPAAAPNRASIATNRRGSRRRRGLPVDRAGGAG